MRKAVVAMFLLAWTAIITAAAGDRPATLPAEEVFGPTKLWTVHISMSDDAWRAMQPPAQSGAAKPAGLDQPIHRSVFGYEFPIVRAAVSFDDEAVADIGIRFKGNVSYRVAATGFKRPLKLEFDHVHKGRRFHGLDKLVLNNNAMDPSQMNETLSYGVFRAAGLPAPRTAYARVYLTVQGRYLRMYLGLYTLTEDVDKTFLRSRFGSSDGLVLKPEGGRLPYLGPNWKEYEEDCRPKGKPAPVATQRFIDFTKLIHKSDDATFAKEIGDYLDVDEFLKYLAVNVMLGNLDSLLITAHNFYLYLDPRDNRFRFIPWDMHLSLGCFLSAGPTGEQADLSIRQAWSPSHRLIERILAIPANDRVYRNHLRRFVAHCFWPAEMHRQIDAIQAAIAPALADEAKTYCSANPPLVNPRAASYPPPPSTKEFISMRVDSISAQLGGRWEGTLPLMLRPTTVTVKLPATRPTEAR